MNEIGLYYPYFHVRDDAWLKAAALYLPQLARVRPPKYPIKDSATAAVLRGELGFLVDLDPGTHAIELAGEFDVFFERERDALIQRYRLPDSPVLFVPSLGHSSAEGFDHREQGYAWLHKSQFGETADLSDGSSLSWRLSRAGLALLQRRDPFGGQSDKHWVAMHPHLVAVYSCALADRLARANSLTLVTHDPRMLTLPGEWNVENLGTALLRTAPPGPPLDNTTPKSLYATIALHTVIPDRLRDVPVEKIVRARQVLFEEFQAFRAHLDSLDDQFTQLGDIDDTVILQARLQDMVNRDLTKPMAELERGLRTLGLQPARAVLGLKSVELPAVAALAAHAVGLPIIIGAGGVVTVQLIASIRDARRDIRSKRNSAPGYLLGLRRHLK